MASARAEWKTHKSNMEKAGIKMTDIADKANFGPALDAFEKAEDAFDKAPGTDQKKIEKAEAEVKKTAAAAVAAGQKYLQVLDHLEKATHDPKHKKALELVTFWLGREIVTMKKKM